jgi:streptomycin 6-kinase
MAASLYSPQFERFIVRHFGRAGRAWLQQLPARVEHYTRLWKLKIEYHFTGGLMSCCLAVNTRDGEAAVLKLDGPWTPARTEIAALTLWHGKGAPSLLGSDPAGGAMLLERIEPGSTYEVGQTQADARELAKLLCHLHTPSPTSKLAQDFPPLADVVDTRITTAGDEAAARSQAEAAVLQPTLDRARRTVEMLLNRWDGHAVILHGDLEDRNILQCRRRGLAAIDPLPCIGDPAYDAGYWAASAVTNDRREQRLTTVSKVLDLDPHRIRLWASVAAL